MVFKLRGAAQHALRNAKFSVNARFTVSENFEDWLANRELQRKLRNRERCAKRELSSGYRKVK